MGQERDSGKNKKIVFMGTPEIATYALKAIVDKGFEIVSVVTQPDKPVGRNKEIIFSPVKKYALENNLRIFQPKKIKDILVELNDLNADAILTCAYGQFIPESILKTAKLGCFNVHASLLPKYRGGAPIHWAIINGDSETGVCLMQTIKQMDAGDIYTNRKIKIDEQETTSSLFLKMNDLVYQIVSEDLENVLNQKIPAIKQDESLVTFAFNISKEQEKISFLNFAKNIRNLIRGLSDKPGAYCYLGKTKIKLFNAHVLNNKSTMKPGTIVDINKNGITIATNDFDLLVCDVQIEGKKRVAVKDIINGNHILKIGLVLE